MRSKTAGLLRFIGPIAIAGGLYAGYTVLVALQEGALRFGSLMGPRHLFTKAHEPESFNALIAFLTFDAFAAVIVGIIMTYFAFFKPTNDDPSPPPGKP